MSTPTLKLPQEGFAERCNRDSFGFGHNLHELGLLGALQQHPGGLPVRRRLVRLLSMTRVATQP